MNKLKLRRVLIFIFLIFFISLVSAGVNVCVIDGYVDDTEGVKLGNAVVSSQGVSSSSELTSNPVGYYLIGNLNNPQNGPVTATAKFGSGQGTRTEISEGSCNAHIDITICYSPSSPVLTPISKTHDTAVNLKWTSGADPKGYSTYDKVEFTNEPLLEVQGSGSHELTKSIGFSTYYWSVQTCNKPPVGRAYNDVFCCSQKVVLNLGAENHAPSKPTNGTGVSSNGLVTLSWISGIDPDSDPTYDQFRLKDYETGEYGGVIGDENNSAINQLVLSEIVLVFEVRTCDIFNSCSAWEQFIFPTCEEVSQTCPNIEEVKKTLSNLGGSSGVFGQVYCNGIQIKDANLIRKIDLELSEKESKVSIFAVKFTKKDIKYCPWCYDGVENYDEKGVDCGGSCPNCEEKPGKFPWWAIVLVILLGILIYYLVLRSVKKRRAKLKKNLISSKK